ncbi:MAG: ABC transporter ATP-binding protein [Kiloniellales bacterium]|nr:ABC transporter ATP-binding protein [Kiloniellales bacterium]
MSDPAPPVLDLRDLTVRLPAGADRENAVEGVSFTVKPREILCVVGESGSGKSVTAHTVMGLLPRKQLRPTAGQILLQGEDLLQKSPAALRDLRGARMSMIFQEPMTALNPVMRIGEQIEEVLQIHTGMSARERRTRVIEVMDAVKLPEPERLVSTYPHQLSGGQRQRVVIAIALACRPALLIADEPTTALDVTIQAQILDLIVEIAAEEGMALLMITHDLGVVAETTDRMLVMYAGRIVERGPTAEVFARLAHPYSRGLFAALPQVGEATRDAQGARAAARSRLSTIPGQVPSPLQRPAGCAFAPRCGHADEACRQTPLPVAEIGPDHVALCAHPRAVAP